MAIYIKINETQYPASITGRLHDESWNNRSSKEITITMTYADAINLFVDNVSWSIMQEVERIEEQHEMVINQETGEPEDVVTSVPVIELEEFDNSEYCIAGDIVDHRDGTITVKMGRYTDHELEVMALQ